MTEKEPPGVTPQPVTKPVAVIDIGTSAIRLAIAEIRPGGQIHKLETLTQDVQLGRDTFTTGAIGRSTIEDCVRVLKSYRQMLDEYQITRNDRIRVVATNAVREADNRLAFLDRVYIATGFLVAPVDEAEVSRITYLGIQSYLRRKPALAGATTLVVAVGGGSTEVLMLRGGDVLVSHSYRLGSLRLRETLEAYRAPTAQLRQIMESQIKRTVDQVVQQADGYGDLKMITLGAEMDFAARQVRPDREQRRVRKLDTHGCLSGRLHEHAESAQIRAAAWNEQDGRHPAAARAPEPGIVGHDVVVDPEIRVDLIDHVVDVAAAGMAVDVDEAGERPGVAMVDDLVPGRNGDLAPAPDGLDLAAGNQDRAVLDRRPGHGENPARVDRVAHRGRLVLGSADRGRPEARGQEQGRQEHQEPLHRSSFLSYTIRPRDRTCRT